MTSIERVWLTQEADQRLRAELAALQAARPVGEPERDARVREIQELLRTAVVGQDPPDDGMAEPGMVLTVRYDDDGDTETFLLGVRGAEHGEDLDIEVYSPGSPLGTALAGARRGERRAYEVPSGATVHITLIDAVPYSHYRGA
ncbi:GreA/GreB family elongation factor [Actinophytocola sediminis]